MMLDLIPRRLTQLHSSDWLFAMLLPFELKTPIVSLGPIVITNVEVLLYALIVLWIFGVLRVRRLHWTLVHSAVLAWLIVQFLAAIFAPVEREAAIKFALRSAGGAALFFIAADWIRSSRRIAVIMSAIAIGAVVSALRRVARNSIQRRSSRVIDLQDASHVGGRSSARQRHVPVRQHGGDVLGSRAADSDRCGGVVVDRAGQRRWLILALAG